MTLELPAFHIRWYVLALCALFSILLMCGIAGIGYWVHGKQGAVMSVIGVYIIMFGSMTYYFATAASIPEDTENNPEDAYES